MSFVKEFKAFAIKGNLVDTAIAFVIGASFGKIVASFIDGMVMPLVGLLVGGVDFNEQKWILKPGVAEVKEGTTIITPAIAEISVKYGAFVTNIIDFFVVALAVFTVIKAINQLKKKEAEIPTPTTAPQPSSTDQLLIEIRDALINKS